jgi:NCS1 family nucleobase:cation symporter-1
MSGWQAVGTVFLANAIVLLPMLLIGHAGTKYGIPYAVLARASFGTSGARLPALMRAIVACGWYGIQTWFGGSMIYTLLGVLLGHEIGGDKIAGLGINLAHSCLLPGLLGIQFWYIVHGMDSIRKLETYTAPLKIVICFVLLGWVYNKAGGFGPLLDQPSQFVEGGKKAGQFWTVFWPSLTAMVGFWATLALNIPDFTRFAKTQRDQVVGQSVGLPVPMGLLAHAGGDRHLGHGGLVRQGDLGPGRPGQPHDRRRRADRADRAADRHRQRQPGGQPGRPGLRLLGAGAQAHLLPVGGYITAGIALVMMPWKILESTQGYIFTWLIGYSALLGPIAGILIVDYYLMRKTELRGRELYRDDGAYSYGSGWNMVAVVAFVLGVAAEYPRLPERGLPASFPAWARFKTVYTYAWFVGIAISALVYGVMMKGKAVPALRPALKQENT